MNTLLIVVSAFLVIRLFSVGLPPAAKNRPSTARMTRTGVSFRVRLVHPHPP